MDSDEFDDDDFASGVFSFKDLKALGIVKDRPDLHRKQKLYGFPRMIKTGERQAGTFRRPVYHWLKKRAPSLRLQKSDPASGRAMLHARERTIRASLQRQEIAA